MKPDVRTMPLRSDPWAALTREVERATPTECPSLLGELERLKASLWIRMTTGTQGAATLQPDRLLTAVQVAEQLQVTPAFVYKMAPEYPFTIQQGRYKRFSEQGLLKYLAKQQGKNRS